MKNDILQLAKKFIAIPSTFDNRKGLDMILDLAISELQNFTVEKFEKDGIKSILVYAAKKHPKRFKIMLNGHLDVIPGNEEQYIPVIDGNKLYGVGSMDMKASAACLITVFKRIVNKVNYPIGLQIVTDEEIGGFKGTKYQIEKGVRSDFVIVGESTNLHIANKAKGILHIKIVCKGKAAHSAYPWRGDNALWKMNAFLQTLRKEFPILLKEKWETTINLSKIETNNNSFNKIPEDCSISLDIRFIPKDKEVILHKINALLPSSFILEVLANEPAMSVDSRNKSLQMLQEIASEVTKDNIIFYGAHGSSDARHYAAIGETAVEFGPKGGNIGSNNEWVEIPSLEQYSLILEKFLHSI